MLAIHEGQCGLCVHFGEGHPSDKKLKEVRVSHKASETLLEECGHPKHASLHLLVTPMSGCDGFKPAARSQA